MYRYKETREKIRKHHTDDSVLPIVLEMEEFTMEYSTVMRKKEKGLNLATE